MESGIKETLEITNFLSIKNGFWEISDFNILTGEMASGKSLCLKLLKFFEDIIPELFTSSYNGFLNNLDKDKLYANLTEKFTNIFSFKRSDNKKPARYKVIYKFTMNNKKNFTMTISGRSGKDIKFKSVYLEKMLIKWNQIFINDFSLQPETVSLERFSEVKRTLYYQLLKEFRNIFPIRTIFIPASRATLLFSSSYTDKYLSDYSFFLRFLPRYKSSNLEINKILKADINNDSDYYLDSKDGRRVPLEMASSGQQEIATILLLLDKLGNFRYSYGVERSIIIEELSAHIFPSDQKETIELIVSVFRSLKNSDTHSVRFFMTVHSPIILDCLDNMIKKGILLEKHGKRMEKQAEINKLTKIPPLYPHEISAYFINGDGKMENIFSPAKKQIEVKKIKELLNTIKADAQKLTDFKNKSK